MFVVAVIVVATVLVVPIGFAVMRWLAARNIEDVMDALEPTLLPLPEGHRPPPGLGPISPSERTLSAEVERGMRDLQAYLFDAA